MEVDGLDVSRFIAKAATPDFDALDAAIHTLRRPIACLQYSTALRMPHRCFLMIRATFLIGARRLRMAQAYHCLHPFSAQVRLA